MADIGCKVIVSGHVQGVGFRYFTSLQAQKLILMTIYAKVMVFCTHNCTNHHPFSHTMLYHILSRRTSHVRKSTSHYFAKRNMDKQFHSTHCMPIDNLKPSSHMHGAHIEVRVNWCPYSLLLQRKAQAAKRHILYFRAH